MKACDVLNFLKRERLYLFVLAFVLVFNLIILFNAGQGSKGAGPSAAGKTAVEKSRTYESVINSRRAEMEELLRRDRGMALLFSLVSLLLVAIIGLGMALDIILARPVFNGSLNIRTLSPPPVKWGLWDVCKVAILFLFFGYIIIISEASLSRVFPVFRADHFRMMVNSSILDLLAVVFIFYFTLIRHKEGLSALGISSRNFFKNMFYGAAGYVALVPVLALILLITAGVLSVFKHVPQRQLVEELFLKEKDAAFLAYSSFFAVVIGPVVEEIFFRGFFYGALKKHTGIFWAMAITASVFALLHAHAVGFVPIMALGMLLAYLYEKTGSLVSSVTAHIIHNLGMVLLVFMVKQSGVA